MTTTFAGRRGEVNVVITGSGTDNDLQVFRCFKYFGCDFVGTDDKSVHVSDGGDELRSVGVFLKSGELGCPAPVTISLIPATAAAEKGFCVATNTFMCLFLSSPNSFMQSYKSLNVLDGAGIVEGSPEASDRAVTLDADHAALLGERKELILKRLVARSHHEADVHQRAVLLRGGADKQRVAVYL